MIRFASLVLTTPLLASCANLIADQAPPVRRRDSAGVAIVENAAPIASLPVWRVDPTPVVSIGGGEPPDAFTMIAGARRVSDGSILVSDGRAGEVKLFDRAGKFLKTLGRKGSGPGEFQSPWMPTLLAGDSIYLIDFALRRAALYRGATHLTDVATPQPSRALPVQTIGMISADTFVATGIHMDAAPRALGTRYRTPMSLLRVSRTGLIDTLAVGKGFEARAVKFSEGGHSLVGSDPIGMGGQTKVLVHGRTLLLGDTETAEFQAIGLRDRSRRVVRWSAVPDPVTAADRRASYVLDSTRLAASPGNSALVASMMEAARTRIFAERAPAFTDFLGADDGSIWVEQFPRPWTLTRRYLVFDPTGALRARVELPPNVRPFQVAGDQLIARWRDEDDVDHVRVYRIRGR